MAMPVSSYASALAAYRSAARSDAAPPLAEAAASPDDGFAGLVKTAVREAVAITERGEQASYAAIAGEADITRVVTAIAEAEVTLQTVVAVRDKLIDAYQDILHMPV